MHSQESPYSQAPSNGSNGSDPTAHRDANTTMRNAETALPRRGRILALALGAYGAGLLGVVLAAMTLALFVMYKGQAQTQLGPVRHELATTQTRLAKAQARDDSRYTKMVGSVSNIGNALAPYTSICSTDLQRQAGPAQYWFACSDAKP